MQKKKVIFDIDERDKEDTDDDKRPSVLPPRDQTYDADGKGDQIDIGCLTNSTQ